ncbi:hypothetical protein AQUCO_04500126v1 [Aquilegia coerulea]|nr:hypothetical protein AQUCO_04500126v1 [Aquilegia coerulea]
MRSLWDVLVSEVVREMCSTIENDQDVVEVQDVIELQDAVHLPKTPDKGTEQQRKPKVRSEDGSLNGSWHSGIKVRYVRKKRSCGRRKKRTRNETQPPEQQRKPNVLLFGDKVEVWREDESFKGSWHSGNIVGVGGSDHGLVCYVRYDDLVLDDGSTKHSISISSNIDETKHYRGLIRPVPPPRLIDNNVLELHYGLCVDVYSKNSWWEGVVFDYEIGCEQRLIFLPDLGNQQKVSIEQIRITQDWNQVSGNWSLRGNWLFLELIQEKKKGLLITLLDNEIWSIVKAKEDFDNKIVDWTCPMRSLWDVLVSEVIREMCSTIENDQDVVEVQDEVLLPKTPDEGSEQIGGTQPIFDLAEFDEDVDLTPEVDLTASEDKISKSDDSVEIVLESQVDHILPFIAQNEETMCASGLPSDSKSSDPVSIDDSRWIYGILMEAEESLVNTISSHDSNLADNGKFSCNAVNRGLAAKALATDPNAVTSVPIANYGFGYFIPKMKDGGWTVAPCMNVNRPNDDDEVLLQSQESVNCTHSNKESSAANDKEKHSPTILSRVGEAPRTIDAHTTADNQNRDEQAFNKPDDRHSEGTRHSTWQSAVGTDLLPGAEYCPDVLQKYLQTANHSRNSEDKNDNGAFTKIRKHLVCMGWKIEFKQNELENKYTPVFRYIAPNGKTIDTLFEACKYYFEITIILDQMIQNQTSGSVPDKMLDGRPVDVDASPCVQTTDLKLPEGGIPYVDPVPVLDKQNYQPNVVDVPDKMLDCNNRQDHSSGDLTRQGAEGDASFSQGTNLILDISDRQAEPLGGESSVCAQSTDLDLLEGQSPRTNPVYDSQNSLQSLVSVPDKMLDSNNSRDYSSADPTKQGAEVDACISQSKNSMNDISEMQIEPVVGDSSLYAQTTVLDLSEGELPPVNFVPDGAAIEAEYCPQAVLDWTEIGSDKGKVKLANQTENTRSMTLRAKKHLVAVGWKLWYCTKMKNKRELRYTSPKRKTYISLVAACKACVELGLLYGDAQPR